MEKGIEFTDAEQARLAELEKQIAEAEAADRELKAWAAKQVLAQTLPGLLAEQKTIRKNAERRLRQSQARNHTDVPLDPSRVTMGDRRLKRL